MTLTPITEALDAQGRIDPGTEGWWQVWGASSRHIRVGDMVMAKWGTGEVTEYFVTVAEWAVTGMKIMASDGSTPLIGGLQKIVLLRWGTHHTLAD